MVDEPDYLSLSKRFLSLAERTADPVLAGSYRKRRYEPIADGNMPGDAQNPSREQD